MLICGKLQRARKGVGGADLGGAVRAPVDLEDAIVEVLDAQAQARDPHLPDRLQLVLGQRPGLALERDLFRLVPRRDGGEVLHQPLQLVRRQERRRAAAEVHEVQRPSGNRRLPRVHRPLLGEHVEVAADLLRVLVGIDAEIAEMTPLPAERDVQIEPERRRGVRRRLQRRLRVALDGLGGPHRKRRIGRDEIAADFGLCQPGRGFICHCFPSTIASSACHAPTGHHKDHEEHKAHEDSL